MNKKIRIKIIMMIILIMIFCMLSIKSKAVTNETNQKLTENELTTFTNLLNQKENNGFIQSIYSNEKNINLNGVFYNLGTEEVTEEEKNDLLKLFDVKSFEIPVLKLTEQEIKDIYKTKTGEEISSNDIKQRLSEWKYSEKYNAYYTIHGDSSLQKVKCISGEKDSNGIYKIVIKSNEENSKLYIFENGKEFTISNADQIIVTLQKKGDNYIFVSNSKYVAQNTDEKKDNNIIDNTKIQNENLNKDTNKDNSISSKELPKTGINEILFGLIILVILVGIVWNEKLNKYKDIK